MRTVAKLSGRGWAYTGAILGGAVSVAANVAHSYVPPEYAPADWTPHTGAVVGAVFWPIALFVAVEIFARIAWPDGRRWTALRFLGLLPVALVAAVVSYRHLSGLLTFYREDTLTATIGPLAVDGLMVMATGALIATGSRRAAGTAAEQVAETATDAAPPAPAAAPAPGTPTPPIAAGDAAPTLAPRNTPKPKPARTPKRQPSAADRVARAVAKTPNATPAQIAARLKLSERTVQRHMPRPADDSVSTAPTAPALSAVA
ncbi:hypothetical protein [Planosporangium mesophilum]|uniref:DUF2637 domain-containing protein n=1 Tax=Planosporangium mesophilum TaxID=689768 RepID=A0A8J3T5Y6_9ACTN|nr:hypothetical protein [Planosporangium mesophilum]NJC81495.1 hypothetical protein [Planosporangium mesophilum]GII20848.1 hypothetical protein Pme01_04450 [Planosporangium mesophilum]